MQNEIEEYNRLFDFEKAEINRQLLTGDITDGPLHEGIKDLIHALNKLPFLYTTQSGTGGVHTKQIWEPFTASSDGRGGSYAILPANTRVMFWPGDLWLVLKAEKQARRFKIDLEGLIAKSPGASYQEGLPLLQSNNPKLKGLTMWIDFTERAPNERMAPHKAPVLHYAEAIRRDGYRRAFLSGLWAQTIEYLDSSQQR